MITPSSMHTDYDVIIVGGSFSGSSAGLLLKQSLPDLRVLIVERQTAFDKKVGESTSEVAGCFLTRVLNLSTYLSMRHINKHGLRMWFHSQPDDTPGDCTEIGPSFQSRPITQPQLHRREPTALWHLHHGCPSSCRTSRRLGPGLSSLLCC